MGVQDRRAAHRVVVLALDGVYPFELGIPSRVFGAAEHAQHIERAQHSERAERAGRTAHAGPAATTAEPAAGGPYEVLTCSVDGGPVTTNADFSVTVGHGPEVLATADTLLLPPFDTSLVTRELPSGVAEALATVPVGARIVSICTGAFVLAAAGLLDGRPATTHWALASVFRSWYPQVDLDPDVLFVDDGDVLTSAGAASGVDACLHLVRRDHGAAVANLVGRICVVPPWRDGGQAQYILHPVPDASANGTSATRQWALEHLQEPLTLADLAGHARMSLRTFARRFNEEVGMSPGRWLIQQRVTRAQHLLETTDLAVDDIAGRAGFGTGTSLRDHLHAAIGVSPLAYRRTFRGGPAAGAVSRSMRV